MKLVFAWHNDGARVVFGRRRPPSAWIRWRQCTIDPTDYRLLLRFRAERFRHWPSHVLHVCGRPDFEPLVDGMREL